jgi:hypothetical protein
MRQVFYRKSKHTIYVNFLKSCAVYEIMQKKYGRATQDTDDSLRRCRKDVVCMPDNSRKNADTD